MFFILLGMFTIISFIIISFFDNPAADDFYFSNPCRQLGFWGAQIHLYTKWTGRYFSSAVLSINPALLFNQFFIYKLIPIILIVVLFFSIYYLVKLVFLSAGKRDIFLLTLFIFIVYLFQMPAIAQGIYWATASLTYQLANCLAMLLLCSVIKLMRTGKIKFLVLSVLLTFCVVGSNETIMIVVDFLLTSIFILNFIGTKKINHSLLILLIFAALFSGIVIIAPGNYIRETFFPNKHQLIHSAVNSTVAIVYYAVSWLPLLLFFTLLFFNSLKKYTPYGNSIFDVNPVAVVIICCCIPVIGFFPGYWSTGYSELRTINTIYFFFIMSFFYLVFYAFFYFRKRGINNLTIPSWVRYVLCVIIIINMAKKGNIRDAYSDLLNGSAYHYDCELKSRYQLITHATGDTCYVPEIKSHPITIFVDDIQADSKDWRNECYDAYWQKSISLEK